MINIRSMVLLIVAVMAPVYSTPAADPSSASEPKSKLMQFLEQDYLLGTWGGLRTDLSKRGVDFEFVYFGAVPSNVGGGIKQGSVYEGAFLMMLDLDSHKLAGYHGGHFHAGGLSIHNGDAFSQNYVGDLNVVSLLDFPDSFRLWELWYEQKFFQDKISLKLGQLDIGRDFILPEYYNTLASISLLNQTFFYPTLTFNVYDIPGLPPGNHALASTPYGTPGARLRIDPIERFYVQAGVYDGNPDRTRSGTRIRLASDEGALAYFEAGYKLNGAKGDEGLPGSYKVGGFLHTDDFLDLYDTIGGMFGFTAGTEPAHGNNWGVYMLAEQMLYREKTKDDPAQQGLVSFVRLAAAPPDRNLTQFGADTGVVYKGLIPGRDWDTLALAGSYLEMSKDFRNAQRDANAVVPDFFVVSDYEAVIEASYKAQMTAWWTLQPSIQRVFHPGGSKAIPDAWAVIVMSSLRF
jgi:porin